MVLADIEAPLLVVLQKRALLPVVGALAVACKVSALASAGASASVGTVAPLPAALLVARVVPLPAAEALAVVYKVSTLVFASASASEDIEALLLVAVPLEVPALPVSLPVLVALDHKA